MNPYPISYNQVLVLGSNSVAVLALFQTKLFKEYLNIYGFAKKPSTLGFALHNLL